MTLCLDKFVADLDDIDESNTNGYRNSNKTKNCEYFRENNILDKQSNDFFNQVNPAEGCCFSPEKTDVTLINNVDDLENYKNNLLQIYTSIYNSYEMKKYLDLLMNNSYENLSDQEDEKFTPGILKDAMYQKLKGYERLFLGVEQDVERLEKLVAQFRNVNPNNMDNFEREVEREKNFRNSGSKEKELFYYDKSSYALFQTVFYATLSLLSILFIRFQVKK